jgi:hypothetical protein
MNALRAPMTTLYVSAKMEIFFSLDTADAFIDGRLIITDSCGVYAWIEPCGQRSFSSPVRKRTRLPKAQR